MALPREIKAGNRSSCLRVHYRFVTSWRSPRDLRLSALSALREPHSPRDLTIDSIIFCVTAPCATPVRVPH